MRVPGLQLHRWHAACFDLGSMRRFGLALVLVLAGAPTSEAQTAETLLRAVSYDRNLDARTPDGLRLAILFHEAGTASREEADRFRIEVESLEKSGSPLAPAWIETLPFADEVELYRFLVSENVSALYVSRGLQSFLDAVIRASEAAGVVTLASSPEDVGRGLVVGVRESKNKLVVNMPAAARSGVDFDPVVRQVAERVRAEDDVEPARERIRETLSRYRDAIETKDLAGLRAIWPGLTDDEAKRVSSSFRALRSQKVSLAVLRVTREGAKARARVRRTDRLVTREGESVVSGALMEIVLVTADDGSFRIDSMDKARPIRKEKTAS